MSESMTAAPVAESMGPMTAGVKRIGRFFVLMALSALAASVVMTQAVIRDQTLTSWMEIQKAILPGVERIDKRLSVLERISPADVMATVELLRVELCAHRQQMGTTVKCPPSVVRATSPLRSWQGLSSPKAKRKTKEK